MARGRYGRKSNVGKKQYTWNGSSYFVKQDPDLEYSNTMEKREWMTSTLHEADNTNDIDTLKLIAKYANIDLGESTDFPDIRDKLWEAYDNMSIDDISYLHGKFHPSYEK